MLQSPVPSDSLAQQHFILLLHFTPLLSSQFAHAHIHTHVQKIIRTYKPQQQLGLYRRSLQASKHPSSLACSCARISHCQALLCCLCYSPYLSQGCYTTQHDESLYGITQLSTDYSQEDILISQIVQLYIIKSDIHRNVKSSCEKLLVHDIHRLSITVNIQYFTLLNLTPIDKCLQRVLSLT